MFLMQLFPALAKVRVPALLPAMVAAACTRGPELAALPPVPQSFWDREWEARERAARERAARGQAPEAVPEDKWKEGVAERWREALLAAVADLKVAQVRGSVRDSVRVTERVCVRAWEA